VYTVANLLETIDTNVTELANCLACNAENIAGAGDTESTATLATACLCKLIKTAENLCLCRSSTLSILLSLRLTSQP
jgi:hypothetical protein